MKMPKNLTHIWVTLMLVVSGLMLTLGLAFIIIDRVYIKGGLFITTSIVFGTVAFHISRERITLNLLNPLLSLGFILSIIGLAGPSGLTLNIGIWALGISLFVLGIIVQGKKAAE
jgi:hypothetical protein